MFDDARGFHQTLAGSYSLLTSSSAYGRELTVGFPDEIVRYWNQQSEFYNFNYTDATVASRLSATWNKLYEAIANLNLLLEHAKDKNAESLENYNLIVGEAKALRAYIHLDLLRLFGPVLKNGLEQPSIPYREEFSNNITKRMSAGEVIGKIKTDLGEAYQLLQDDPVRVNGRKDTVTTDTRPESPAFAYHYRGVRMNYYAVCATLARVHLLTGEKSKALDYAMEVINDHEAFQLSAGDVLNLQDLMFQRELVWSLYCPEMNTLYSASFGFSYNIDVDFRTYIYTGAHAHGLVDDYRLNHWWGRSSTVPVFDFLKKYQRTFDQNNRDITAWDPVISMIRLSEVYYMAAEANIGTNNTEARRLLNLVRDSRNLNTRPLPEGMSNNDLMEQIVYETLKDAWGEGKLFYLYKRLFHPIIIRESSIPASNAIFELPIPREEIEHGGNKV